MDFQLKQWRNHHESEQQPSAKIPKLLLDPHQPQPQPQQPSAAAALPLFLPEPNNSKISNLSAFPDSTTTARFPKMGGSFFSLAQWQELELQALIFRYMLAGAAVPPELLQPIKKSLLHSPSYFLHHPLHQQYPYYQPALLQAGYWGRAAMDPEPGRCRRTDGKKWRCSRDVVAGQKYCERHVHRGRNRSRKPVEIPTPTSSAATANAGGGGFVASAFNCSASIAASSLAAVANGTSFSLSGQSATSVDLLHVGNSSSDSKPENKGLLGTQNRSDGHILRHFFDDWPRSLQEPDNNNNNNDINTNVNNNNNNINNNSNSNGNNNASPMNSATCLSISMPGNSSSDVSLKLSTGDGDESGSRGNEREQQPQLNWGAGWGTHQVASMGGPLAEALRSSTSNLSPTSVLHQLPRCSASETSYVST